MIKNATLTINADNTSATLSNQINVYRGDGNITLKLTVAQQVYQFGKPMVKTMALSDSDVCFVNVDVVVPQANSYFTLDTVELVDNQFTITLAKEWCDEVQEVGTYKLQINMFDSENNKASLPPFSINVLPRLIDTVQTSKVGDTINTGIVRSDSDYVQVETAEELAYWKDGETLSPERMNNMLDVVKLSESKINTAISTANDTLTQTKAIQTEMIENNKQMVQESTARVDEAIDLCEQVFSTTLRYHIVE